MKSELFLLNSLMERECNMLKESGLYSKVEIEKSIEPILTKI